MNEAPDDFTYYSIVSEDFLTKMNATEFERIVASHLQGLGEEYRTLKVTHNKKITRPDGTYQIDVYASFTALDV